MRLSRPRIDNVVPTAEYTLGGPIMRDRLWFFTSGRLRDESQGRTLIATAVPDEFREEQRRYEVKGTYSLTPDHRFQVNYNHHDRSQINNSFNQHLTMDQRSLGTRRLQPNDGANRFILAARDGTGAVRRAVRHLHRFRSTHSRRPRRGLRGRPSQRA